MVSTSQNLCGCLTDSIICILKHLHIIYIHHINHIGCALQIEMRKLQQRNGKY